MKPTKDGLEVLTLTETKSGQKLSHPSMAIVLLGNTTILLIQGND